MKLSLFVAGIALLAGCAQSNSVPPGSIAAVTHGATPPANRIPPLLYVADAGNDDVKFFEYPLGKLDATLTGFGAVRGLCANKLGEVYVADAQKSEIVRYSHGGKVPSKILYDQGYRPNGCAIDNVSGRLAVTLTSESTEQGVLAIFTHAAGRPVYYAMAGIVTPAYCAFDSKGNLFIDGTDYKGNFALGQMAFGYHTVLPVTLNQTIAVPGAIQWDGKYLAVGDEGTGSNGSTIYQFTINGSAGTLKGTVTLNGSSKVAQFWIGQTKFVGPDSGSSNVRFWAYPGGGTPLKTIGGFKQPVAAVVAGTTDE